MASNFGALGCLWLILGMYGTLFAPGWYWLAALGIACLAIAVVARILDRPPA